MKKAKTLILLLLTALVFPAATSGFDAIGNYRQANIAYQKQDFEQSIKLYEELIKNNKVSSDIFYNLGNAYFKNGNFSKAILNYERSLKLSPDDEDAMFNLKIASLKVVDKMESVPEIFYKKWLNAIARILPSNSWTILFIVMIWILFSSLAFYFLGNSVRIKKISFLLTILFLVFTAATGFIAARSHSINNVEEKAIIMSSSVYIKSSPDDKGNDLFILHEGTKVEILDKLNTWSKIRIANGGIGWMPSGDLEKI
jgi:tetratricopeptide (TPR) repeat protein